MDRRPLASGEAHRGASIRSLADTTALVTGASSGIGAATALALAQAGASVVLAARRVDELQELAARIEADGGVAIAVPTDVSDDAQVAALVDTALDAFGPLDIVVNCAAIADWDNTGVLDSDLAQWRREIEVNLLGVMSVVHHAAPHVREGGHVVDISSGADRGFAGAYPTYVASKWGLRGFNGSVAQALHARGVRVTLVSPGEVATPMQPAEDLARGGMLEPEDVADAVLFAVTRPPRAVVSEIRLNPTS